MTSQFTIFAKLPSELRNKIWLEALLSYQDPPALFIYPGKRCWIPYCETDKFATLVFRDDLLDCVHVKLPLLYVNREARGLTLAKSIQGGFQSFSCEDKMLANVLARHFDSKKDALYIPHNKHEEFSMEQINEGGKFEDGWSPRDRIKEIAIPSSLLRDNDKDMVIHWIISDFYGLKRVSLLVDPPPNLCLDEGSKVQRHWRIQEMYGRTLNWNTGKGELEGPDIENDKHGSLLNRVPTGLESKEHTPQYKRLDLRTFSAHLSRLV